MHNTISDIALTNVSRETFLLFCVAPKQKFFVFPQPREYVSSMFLNSGHLQPHVLVKRLLIKKMYVHNFGATQTRDDLTFSFQPTDADPRAVSLQALTVQELGLFLQLLHLGNGELEDRA